MSIEYKVHWCGMESHGTAYFLRMYSPREIGWSVEGEGVAERLGGGASVEALLELAERLNLRGSSKGSQCTQIELTFSAGLFPREKLRGWLKV